MHAERNIVESFRSTFCHEDATTYSIFAVVDLQAAVRTQPLNVPTKRKNGVLCTVVERQNMSTIQISLGSHVRCPIILSDFNQIWGFTTDFRKKNTTSNFTNSPPSGSHADIIGTTDRQTDRQDEANRRFSLFTRTCPQRILKERRTVCVCVCVRACILIGWDSFFGITTCYRLQGGGEIFRTRPPTKPLVQWTPTLFLRGKSDRVVALTTHLHLATRLKKSKPIPLHRFCAFIARSRVKLTLPYLQLFM